MRRRRSATRRRATRQVAVFRANPIRRRRRRTSTARRRSFRRNPVALFAPRRRRRHATRRAVAHRRYRRNPSARGASVAFGKMFLPAAGIGLGAVGSEILMGYLPIPANFKVGVMRHVTKGAVGVAAGLILGKVFRQKRLGNFFALGAVAIAVHDGVKEWMSSKLPSIHMGQYRPGIRSSLGYANPAQIARIGQFVPPIASSFAGASSVTGGETAFRA